MTNENTIDINEIAQLADTLPKSEYNKKAVYYIFREALRNNGQFDKAGLASLYAYFMPSLPAKPKTGEQWVAMAMANKDIRYYLNYIYSDGNRIMATDGHRLHIVNKSVEQGFYDKQMNKIEVDAQYPDVDRVIPKNCNKQTAFSGLVISDCQLDGKTIGIYKINNVAVSAQYLKKACLGFDDPIIQYYDKSSPLLITDNDRTAVVMPMRID